MLQSTKKPTKILVGEKINQRRKEGNERVVTFILLASLFKTRNVGVLGLDVLAKFCVDVKSLLQVQKASLRSLVKKTTLPVKKQSFLAAKALGGCD